MAALVREYKQQYPSVHVTLFEMTATEQIHAFKNDLIYVDSLEAIVDQNHALANYKNIDLAKLKNEPFIIFNREEALGLFDETILQCKH